MRINNIRGERDNNKRTKNNIVARYDHIANGIIKKKWELEEKNHLTELYIIITLYSYKFL